MPPGDPAFISRRAWLSAASSTLGVGTLALATPPVAVGVGGGAIHGSAQPNPHGARWAKKRFPGDPGVGRVYYGSVIDVDSSIEKFERLVGHPLGSHRNFHQSTQAKALIARARADVAAKRFSMLSIKPPGSWKSVAESSHNAWLDEILDGLGALHAPMTFTVNHEPENNVDASENTPGWHKRMTEFIFARAAVRAPKVHVIQILMQYTFKNGNGLNPADWLAPSVRLFGMDAYNYWVPGGSVEWISFRKMVSRAQEWADGKPVVIGEYGVHTDPSRPGRAAHWMEKAFNYATKHDVIAMNYFNTAPTGVVAPFTLDAERLSAFKKCANDDRAARLRHKSR